MMPLAARNPRKKLWLLLLTIVAVLFVQSLRVHIHTYDHAAAAGHSHVASVQVDYNVLHDEHHDGVMAELNVTSLGVLKNVSPIVWLAALWLLSLMPRIGRRRYNFLRRRHDRLVLPSSYSLTPPLRAPPLY